MLPQIDSFTSWKNLASTNALIKLVPAVGATAALLLTLKHSRNPFVLPVILVAIPLTFHAVLLATGTSLQQAADAGWLMQPEVRNCHVLRLTSCRMLSSLCITEPEGVQGCLGSSAI